MAHVRALSVDIGVRAGGSAAEARAADYLEGRLRSWGYTVTRQAVPLPWGASSVNVIAERAPGATWIVGAHLDSKPPSPGGNDNATGVAVLLECARLRAEDGVRFVFFGAEEYPAQNRALGHHFGSRYYVGQMSAQERAAISGVVVVDAVGGGPRFAIGTMRRGDALPRRLRVVAWKLGFRAVEDVDPGWSDHEPFFVAGIPTAYLRWRIDDTLHTAADTYAHVRPEKVRAAFRVLQAFLGSVGKRSGSGR